MGCSKELSIAIRAQAFLLHKMSKSQREIACMLKVSQNAVRRCIERQVGLNGDDFKSKSRSGRPRISSCPTDVSINATSNFDSPGS